MSLKNSWIIVCGLLFTFLPRCRAPPVDPSDSEPTSELPVASILRTIVLGYMAHIVTVRPQTGVDNMGTNVARFICFTYPTWGISIAFDAIHDAYYADKILGIDNFKILLKKYEEDKDTTSKNEDHKSLDSAELISPLSQNELIPEYSPTLKDDEQDSPSDVILSKTKNLRDWLVDYMAKNNTPVKEYDNAPYLAALLHTIGPKKAKKVKHCILNKHMLLGFDSRTYKNVPKREDTRTENISVTGPGAECEYQSNIQAENIRYLKTEMISKIRTSYNVDNISYIETFITIVQLFFTTIECMDINGNKWAKLIMIVYTAMSVIQTLSLVILHKQTEPFSLHYNEDVPWKEVLVERGAKEPSEEAKIDLADEDIEETSDCFKKHQSDLFYKNSFLHFVMENRYLEAESDSILTNYSESTTIAFCLFGGMAGSLLIGIWADYSSHSVVQWIVLAWILSPMLILLGTIIDWFSPNPDSDTFIFLSIMVSVLCNFGCIIAATIYGYIVDNEQG
ncbi:hypothetical protein F4703DRAFT_1878029 [Phycomyces blakesleeanus]